MFEIAGMMSFAHVMRLAAAAGSRFIKREGGAAAVQFAFVAMPFLALTFAILEAAMIFFVGQTLETAAANAGRLIMTGQAQNQSMNAAQFKSAACAILGKVMNCSNQLVVDVRTYTSFANAGGGVGQPLNGGNQLTIDPNSSNPNMQPQFRTGNPGDIVVVRLWYVWPVWIPMLHLSDINNSSGISTNGRVVLATAAFRNEPYTAGP